MPLLASVLALLLGGCSTLSEWVQGDRIDYKSASRAPTLEVPPDLAQLRRDPRFQVPDGPVSAASYQAQTGSAGATAAAAQAVAPAAVGDIRVERAGTQRWLATSQPPEVVLPALRQFWLENGFVLTTDNAETGVLETDWAENRAKLPQDVIRRTVGRIFDSIYSTGELDRFRTRIERSTKGTEIYVSHRGMVEVYSGAQQETTVWQPRDADPDLEAIFLQRMMLKLGATEEVAKTELASAPARPRARVVQVGEAPVLQIDEGFDRAWRRVGLSLDRTGFTVEDRDRAQGVYFVRYVAPGQPGIRGEPGFLARLFRRGEPAGARPENYRITLSSQGEATTVSVLNREGGAAPNAAAQRIVSLLATDLQ